MSQEPVWFNSQDLLAESAKKWADRVLAFVRAPQTKLAFGVVVSLLFFGVVAVSPNSAYPTMQLLLTYNALLLCYLSAFWGLWSDVPSHRFMGLPYSPRRIAIAERDRLLWSLAPTVLGGSGMLLPLFLPQDIGTLMLLVGFGLLVTLEAIGSRKGLPAANHKNTRWTISIAAMVILIDVLANQRWAIRIFF